jgi:nucleoside-diphosphate-sugar epimerase
VRVVVIGATGNVGTSLLAALEREPQVTSALGLARRVPDAAFARTTYPKTTFVAADVTRDDLVPHLGGADAVVHLAWLIQPSRDKATLARTNVLGSQRVFDAAVAAGVRALVVASSIGVYSPGPGARPVAETWPRDGVRESWYSRHKAEIERRLDLLDEQHADLRVVRLRPAYSMKRAAASGQRRLFFGPFLPTPLLKPGRVPFIPDVPGLRVQVVHSDDVGEAYRLAVVRDVRGAFNIAAEPVLSPQEVARALGSRTLPVPARLLRVAAGASWLARLQPTSPDWVDLALGVPVLDTARAQAELGWQPRWTAPEILREWFTGVHESAGFGTPPLDAGRRVDELTTGVGGRESL